MASVARVTEISARSEETFDDAVDVGIELAHKTLRNGNSASIKEMRVEVSGSKISTYQVNLLVTVVLDD